MAYLLAAHAHRLIERLRVDLARAAESPSEPRIHALRVSLKKLATQLRLARYAAPHAAFPDGPMRRVKALFKAAGREREAQVSRALLAELPQSLGAARMAHEARLHRQERKARQALLRRLQDWRPKDLDRIAEQLARATASLTHAQELDLAARYAEDELQAASRLLAAEAPGAQLHAVRKHVKNAWYTLRLLPARRKDEARTARLAQAQQRLGLWHDWQTLRSDLTDWKGGGEARAAIAAEAARRLARMEAALLRYLPKALRRGGPAAADARSR